MSYSSLLIHLQVFIDETPVSKRDLLKVAKGEESGLASSLNWLAQRVKLVWVSLSTTDLLDQTDDLQGTSNTSMKALTDHLTHHCSSFKVRKLGLTMRNSAHIAKAAQLDMMKRYNSGAGYIPTSVLPPGIRSTVPGSRPYCILTRWANSPDYKAIERSMEYAFKHLLPLSSHTAILCSDEINPQKVAPLITTTSILYDGGIDKYSKDGQPRFICLKDDRLCDARNQRPDLERWLASGGLLVTHERLFRGMEAPSILYITNHPGTSSGVRSSMMRAVATLVMIARDSAAEKDMLGENFEVVCI